jgi:Rrf2 family nitric oxide-sensitive transcriptional repressor
MQLTSHTDHALRILIYLMVNPERKISTREIAELYGISLHHLTKVAKSLVKGGWLLSTRGGNGGLVLAPHTPATTIGDIVRYTENMALVVCFTQKTPGCPIATVCQLKPVIHRARQAFFDVLDSTTIAEISRNQAELNFILKPAPRRVSVNPSRSPKPGGKQRKA